MGPSKQFCSVWISLDALGVIGFERAIVRLMEQSHYRHEFAWVHMVRASAFAVRVSPKCFARPTQVAAKNCPLNKRVRVYLYRYLLEIRIGFPVYFILSGRVPSSSLR